jgi:hypothetical protein
MKTWTVDLGSLSIVAETKEEAIKIALGQISRGEDICIDQIIEGEEVDDDD